MSKASRRFKDIDMVMANGDSIGRNRKTLKAYRRVRKMILRDDKAMRRFCLDMRSTVHNNVCYWQSYHERTLKENLPAIG